ncbi:Uncharacterised protein [Segatella copri]|nr:Uncharacterised protein [Segatella copri]
MARRSSSSALNPSAITSPLLTSCGGSGCISLAMRSFRVSHTFSCSPTRFRASFVACWHATLIGLMASSAFFS